MCFGTPQAPNIVYKGPSDEEIAMNQASLDAFKDQMATQQQTFQTQLQSQIDAANQQTAQLQEQLGNEQAAAAAAAAAQQTSTYATTTQQADLPTNAQTTAAKPKKNKPTKTLKINRSLMAASEGAGLNIGV